MKFTFDSSGTPQQKAWAQEAIGSCGYDLSLLPYNVTVVWTDPLPASDTGHLHSYMVTKGSGSNWTIYVETWADDPLNPNNQGLPDPPNDIYGFYKESFVHELGHVVSLGLLTTTALIQSACSLFWTPDMNGGSGMRVGTVNDWDPTAPWAELIKEAVAEQFKIVYYQDHLIFRNRTIWRLRQQNWPLLWKLLMPPLKGIYNGDNSSSSGTSGIGSHLVVPTQYGLHYVDDVIMYAAIGPIVYTGPSNAPNHGGFYLGGPGLIVRDQNGIVPDENIVSAQGHLRIGYDSFDRPYNDADWSSQLGQGGTAGGFTNSVFPPGVCVITIEVTQVVPGTLSVVCTGPTGQSVAQLSMGSLSNGLLLGTYDDAVAMSVSGDVVCPAAFSWGLKASALPPPYPGGPDGGDIGVGLGYRGAVILGQ